MPLGIVLLGGMGGFTSCTNPFGLCSQACGDQISCTEACNRDSDGTATTCGALGQCQAQGNTGASPGPTASGSGDTGSSSGGNLAFHQRTFQTTTILGAASSRAVDGNTDGKFFDGSVTANLQVPEGTHSVPQVASMLLQRV